MLFVGGGKRMGSSVICGGGEEWVVVLFARGGWVVVLFVGGGWVVVLFVGGGGEKDG